jgi:lipoprotein signal peptidase
MFFLFLTLILIVIDQLTKGLAAQMGWSIFLNDKFAFSLPLPEIVMYSIYALVLAGMTWHLYSAWHRFSKLHRVAWAFVFAGGLSNIGERIVLGYVRDFIPIANGILNIADFYILIGLTLLLISNRYSKQV